MNNNWQESTRRGLEISRLESLEKLKRKLTKWESMNKNEIYVIELFEHAFVHGYHDETVKKVCDWLLENSKNNLVIKCVEKHLKTVKT